MIYVRSSADHPWFVDFKNIKDAKLENESIYWYDKHDYHIRKLNFDKFLDKEHIDHLNRDLTSKILIYYGDEYFNLSDLEMYSSTIKNQNLNPSQIFFIVMDSNWCVWLLNEFEKRGVVGINVADYNLLLEKTVIASKKRTVLGMKNLRRLFGKKDNDLPKMKFSAFSRRFDHWRLELFTNLYLRNLLSKFKYTFNNIDPYVGVGVNHKARIFGHGEIYSILRTKNHNLDLLRNWVDNIPYTLPEVGHFNKWATKTNDWIFGSAFHLLVESHYDPFNNFKNYEGKYSSEEFSPSLITEKTWKVVLAKRPFIVFATPHFLKDFQKLGFKTFSPYIDESYDSIENQDERLTAIVNEIDRLDKLPHEEFENIFKECYNIALYNLENFENLKLKLCLNDNFSWVNQYVRKLNSSNI